MTGWSFFKSAFVISTLLFQTVICSCNEPEGNGNIYTEAPPANNSLQQNNQNISGSRQSAITNAVRTVSPAIVGINVTAVEQVEYRDPFFDDPFFNQFFRRQPRVHQYEVKSLGSGFLISSDGYILTNDHVAGNATKIVVTMTNGEKYEAQKIGSDPTSDVALLKIEGKNFPFLKLSNSDDIIIGEWAIAFGNPFGLFDNNAKPTVTVGVVSNTGVNFTQENRVYRDMIQTDAAISSGNSGGPLINANGEVIAMNTVIFSTAQNMRGAGSIGIGFAVPINRVKEIVNVLKKEGKIDRNYNIGMVVRNVDETIARQLNLERPEGVIIYEIVRGSTADRAGLEPGDVVLKINGTPVHREEDYYVIANDAVVGQTLNIQVQRGKNTLEKKIHLESRPQRSR
ncbi:MAG TPA: trypsin-like peptidase domain-containing protein [Patescibacteria group bacterium]|nr:trypsin-like peptidase domain-containing protein [Patescibacteria group bacterium]